LINSPQWSKEKRIRTLRLELVAAGVLKDRRGVQQKLWGEKKMMRGRPD